MTAGVHHSDIVAVVCGAYFGGKRHIDTFGHRQGVHVRAKSDHRPGFAAFQNADNTGQAATLMSETREAINTADQSMQELSRSMTEISQATSWMTSGVGNI